MLIKILNTIYIGGGRTIRDPLMEQKLLEWYHGFNGDKVTTRIFIQKAFELSNFSTFKASRGWMQKFCKRNNIKLD